MRNYEVIESAGRNGSACIQSTPSSGSTEWGEHLKDRYGIAHPMAEDDGLDGAEAFLVAFEQACRVAA